VVVGRDVNVEDAAFVAENVVELVEVAFELEVDEIGTDFIAEAEAAGAEVVEEFGTAFEMIGFTSCEDDAAEL
jgi:hypothetical protein